MSAELLFWMIVAHFVGDYVLQSDWMAVGKLKRWLPAVTHGVVYGLPFLFITPSPWALLVIAGTHIVIDRYRLARFLVWAKNQAAPKAWRYPWSDGVATGYSAKTTPPHMADWLTIIFDNVIHIVINFLAVKYL